MARRDIVQVARRLRRSYRVRPPIDVETICRGEGIAVECWPLGRRIREMVFPGGIAISAQETDPRWVRFLTAHALGHYLLHAGSVAFWATLPTGDLVVQQQEHQADIFARALCIPGPVWAHFGATRPYARDEDLARSFGVPLQAIRDYRRDLESGNYDPREFEGAVREHRV